MNKNQKTINRAPRVNEQIKRPKSPQEGLALYTKLKEEITRISEQLSIFDENSGWAETFDDIIDKLTTASEEALRQTASPLDFSIGSYGPYRKNKINLVRGLERYRDVQERYRDVH